jgi:hypothetical protein
MIMVGVALAFLLVALLLCSPMTATVLAVGPHNSRWQTLSGAPSYDYSGEYAIASAFDLSCWL